MRHLFQELVIFQRGRTSITKRSQALIIGYRMALSGRKQVRGLFLTVFLVLAISVLAGRGLTHKKSLSE
jgi:hypothetical protein